MEGQIAFGPMPSRRLVDRRICDGKIVEVKYGGQSYFKQKYPRT